MTFILNRPSSATYKEKRSEFIGFSKPIKTASEINFNIKELKSKYPSARHICWAYRLLIDGNIIENSSDAGEPSGSAGLPILNVIKQNNLVNCSIFVVRFFGGIKLGMPGLINAYKTTTALVIAESALIKFIPKTQFIIQAPIYYFGKTSHLIRQHKGSIIINLTEENVKLLIDVPESESKNFEIEFGEMTQNSGKIKKQSEHDQTKEVRK